MDPYNRNDNQAQFDQSLPPQDDPSSGPPKENQLQLRTWVYVLFGVFLLLASFYLSGIFEEKEPAVNVIQAQLELFKAGKITQAYYELTSRDFQQSTSLDTFKAFIINHPLFISYQKAEFAPEGSLNSSGELEIAAVLRDAKGNESAIEYSMIKEDSQWKIWGIHLSEDRYSDRGIIARGQGDKEERDPAFQPIELQLQALKKGNLRQAYYGLMTPEFEQSTPFVVFKQFVESNPILRHFQGFDVVERKVDEDQAEIRVLVQAGKESLSLQYSLTQEEGQWKIWGIKVIKTKPEKKLARENMILVPVEEQISAIREKDFPRAYYTTATKSFRGTTSFADFQKFVTQYPQLKQGKMLVREKSADEKKAFVVADFATPASTLTLKYLLHPEGGEWRILGIEVVDLVEHEKGVKGGRNLVALENQDKGESLLVEEKLKITIREMLTLMRQDDWHTAYKDYTTKDFKESTNSDSFYKFLSYYTIFKQVKTINFDDLSFDGNVALYRVRLSSPDGAKAEVQFDLVKEDGHWKMQQIQVFSYQQAPKQQAPVAIAETPKLSYTKPAKEDVTSFQITKMEIGDAVDGKGRVLFPANDLSIGAEKLYVNVTIRHGSRGEPVELLLAHLPTQSKAPILRSNLPQSGDNSLSFVFTPPQNGWPKGEYVLQALDAAGKIKREEHFVIRS